MHIVTRIVRTTLFVGVTFLAVAITRAADAPQQQTPPAAATSDLKLGAFSTSFTERSPLSAPKEIARRLPQNDPVADYDLAKEQFAVYVPKTYDAAKPAGIVVFLCYKPTTETPPAWHDMLDKNNLIFVVAQNHPEAITTRIGLALDAVHNLQKQYKIDAARIWALGEEAPHLALAYSDTFTAGIARQPFYFRPIKSRQPNSGSYPPKMPRPPGELVTKAKAHPQVLLEFPASAGGGEYQQLIPGAYQQDGFKHVLAIEVDKEPYHYPNFTTDWFEQVMAFIEKSAASGGGVVAAGGAPTTPSAREAATSAPIETATSQPAQPTASAAPAQPAAPAAAPSDAQRLLNLAKSYIAAKAYPQARTRLQTILDKYPTEPAAAEAKKLLQTLP
jgi:hypothetical protein